MSIWARGISVGMICGLVLVMGGCTPRVEVEAPDKPITINLNVKIDHEVRVKVDKDLDRVLSGQSGLF
ncbi:MAG: YnbE family lipoprotein [Nitrospira sp.]|nr:MAG: YnbE family lipoprotein [Nitrospira sp.]